MHFPTIPVFGAMRRVYALMIFYGVILARLAALPLAGLVIVTIGFDLIALALGAQGAQPGWVIGVSIFGELVAELLVMNFLAIRVFRLLLIEHDDERTVFDSSSLNRLGRYGGLHLGLIVLMALVLGAGWWLFQTLAPGMGTMGFGVLLPFALAAFAIYCAGSFVLPAASIPVPYRYQESFAAARGALVPIAMVTLVAVLPWFLLSWAVQTTSGAYVGPTSWVYWAILPLTTVLQCARTISFAVANAVCFEERTGWHPGAEKIEP